MGTAWGVLEGVTLLLKSLNLTFCANQGVASSATERQKAPWEASGQFHDCPTCWDFLIEGKTALLQTGTRACRAADFAAIP